MTRRTLLVAALLAVTPALAQELHYAPEERLDKVDVALIDQADTEIDMAAYVLTDWAIIDALNDAATRGVKVRVILDPRQHSDVARFVGLDVRQKWRGPLMHLKAFSVDSEVLREGSANFSVSGETQQDNDVVIFHDAKVVAKFQAHFEAMWRAAVPIDP